MKPNCSLGVSQRPFESQRKIAPHLPEKMRRDSGVVLEESGLVQVLQLPAGEVRMGGVPYVR